MTRVDSAGSVGLLCAVTGRPARYVDPRTGIGYADIASFKTIRRMLEHQYVWSDSLDCFTGARSDVQRARDAHAQMVERRAAKKAERERQKSQSSPVVPKPVS